MGTSANIIFPNNYFMLDGDNLDKDVSQDYDYIKYGVQIYLHFDGYPEHVVPILREFLKTPGAKTRREDNEYLSVWFIVYYCMNYKLKYLLDIDNYDFYEYGDYYKPCVDDLREVPDFHGVGLHNGENAHTNYTYIITNVDINNFNIWVYDNNMKFIDLL